MSLQPVRMSNRIQFIILNSRQLIILSIIHKVLPHSDGIEQKPSISKMSTSPTLELNRQCLLIGHNLIHLSNTAHTIDKLFLKAHRIQALMTRPQARITKIARAQMSIVRMLKVTQLAIQLQIVTDQNQLVIPLARRVLNAIQALQVLQVDTGIARRAYQARVLITIHEDPIALTVQSSKAIVNGDVRPVDYVLADSAQDMTWIKDNFKLKLSWWVFDFVVVGVVL